MKKDSSYLKNKYFFRFEKEIYIPSETPFNFGFFNNNLYTVDFGILNKRNGNIGFLNQKGELKKIFDIEGNPKYAISLSKDKLIILKHLKQGVSLLDLKGGKEISFIEGKFFINPTSMVISNNLLLVSDLLAHKINVFDLSGKLIEKINLTGRAEFPVDLKQMGDKLLLLTIGGMKFYQEYSSGKENESPLFYIEKNKLKKWMLQLDSNSFPFSSIDIIDENEEDFFILNKYYLYKCNFSEGVLFKTRLEKFFNHITRGFYFYRIKTKGKFIYILEREKEKKIFVFRRTQ